MVQSLTDVLIVDDSALMRRFLSQIFEQAGGYNVRLARNGEAALQQMEDQLPDVVTLDINMPEMDGLTCLSHIMTRFPCPVIMVSSLTEKGAIATLEALELGAVDYVAKPGGTVSHNMAEAGDEILRKVRTATGARPRRRRVSLPANAPRETIAPSRSAEPPAPERPAVAADGLVLIGVSTGGPSALETVLSDLPADLTWPVVITQHMPETFTGVLSKRLNGLCALTVTEVNRPTLLEQGNIYMAQGDRDLEIRRRGGKLVAIPLPADDARPWHPSTDRMVESALKVLPADKLLGVLLTGMGDDGAAAMAVMHRKGSHTVAESEDTAVVYGMPRALVEQKGAETVLPIEHIARQIIRWVP